MMMEVADKIKMKQEEQASLTCSNTWILNERYKIKKVEQSITKQRFSKNNNNEAIRWFSRRPIYSVSKAKW